MNQLAVVNQCETLLQRISLEHKARRKRLGFYPEKKKEPELLPSPKKVKVKPKTEHSKTDEPVENCACVSCVEKRLKITGVKPTPRLRDILREVAKKYSFQVKDLKSDYRDQVYQQPRFEFYWRAKKETDKSLVEIGEVVNRDHTTVLKGIRRYEELQLAKSGVVIISKQDEKFVDFSKLEKPKEKKNTSIQQRAYNLHKMGFSKRTTAEILGTSLSYLTAIQKRVGFRFSPTDPITNSDRAERHCDRFNPERGGRIPYAGFQDGGEG